MNRQIICKHNPGSYFSPIYLIIDREVTIIGSLSKSGIEKLLERSLLQVIDNAKIIEEYFFSEIIITGVERHTYYSLGG